MPRLIDADALKDYFPHGEDWDYPVNKNSYICETIDNMPTVDAVPVIRCKDCKHHQDEEPGMVYCPKIVGGWIEEECYCSWAER